ncbi:hypothetical protein [Sessilibacter sp. MAH4]
MNFYLPKEYDYLLHFVNLLNDQKIVEIITTVNSISREDAEYLSRFFWRMVDMSIELENHTGASLFEESNQFWNEKLMLSISGLIEQQGFENVWNRVVDEQ